MAKTLGEKRVRVDFNVSGSTLVDDIKYGTADMINKLEELKVSEAEDTGNGNARYKVINDPEQLRLIELAQTAYEEAAMWAVKAATFQK